MFARAVGSSTRFAGEQCSPLQCNLRQVFGDLVLAKMGVVLYN